MGEVTPKYWIGIGVCRGRPGAIVIEATGIRDIPSGPLLRISHDRYVGACSNWLRRCGRPAAVRLVCLSS